MAGVPYVFGNATTSIPLTNLDANFNTGLTFGNTTVGLGNTVTTIGNVTLNNVTINSGTSNIVATQIANGTSNVAVVSSGGNIAMTTNGSEVMRITSAGLVGIGTNNPSEGLTVSNGCVLVTGALSALRASSLSLDYNAGQGRFIATGADASTYSTVVLGSATTTTYQERMRLNTNGNLVLQGASTGANGIGVTFPATQSASSDANCLDDYEKGTFTPTFSSSTGAWTSYTATGYYTKVGRMVTVLMGLNITNVGTGSGTITFSNLPFGTLNCSTYGGNRAAVGLFREDAVTGVAYQIFPNGNGGISGQVQSLTGGSVVQLTNYAYVTSFTYQSS
jgi:hypothetical protein